MSDKTKFVRRWVDLPEALDRKLHAAAKRSGFTRDELVRRAVEVMLEEDRPAEAPAAPDEPRHARAVNQGVDPALLFSSPLQGICG